MTTPTETAVRERAIATGVDLKAALVAVGRWLDANAQRIDALNVFPVPDGDTGTNMSLTFRAASDALASVPATAPVSEVARVAYEAAMLGARGNSGVILSQLLRGFADGLADAAELTPDALARALARASDMGYRAVSRPVEGTILTVARAAAEAAQQAVANGAETLSAVLVSAQQAATDAVAATPEQLDVLRKAGVVDAGGEGYRVILEAAWMWSTGRALEDSAGTRPHSRALLEHAAQQEGPTFGFCTEFLLRGCDLPLAEVTSRMEALGDSVIAVGDADLLRVHLHTLRPGQALEFAVDHGVLAKVKVDNMQLQHQAFAAARSPTLPDVAAEPASSVGVIAVATGEGFARVFRSLGATVVQGGQTMNPSVQDLLAAINSSGHDELVILPNNSNIVMTARQVKELSPHAIEVVPTQTVPQGIAAVL
ncbi:MAG: DAK2 domain-containing protein, partial [Chloroflexota bacterium]|nr:DAK2 domain-containing protein [Chloroflexota bacterium]